MGTLYLAEDPSLDRLIAIKLLKDDSDELRQRFIREARTAGRLKHINIVSIFDVGEFEDRPFIAMEYIPGETLGEIIKRRAPLALTRKLVLMEELCAGLAHAHRSGIVHRDVKPANIMLDAEGTLKVLDFGIARWESSGMTRSGVIMGSLNYMSPELVAGRPIDQRSDVFAVGAVTYEFLSYVRAFPGGIPGVFTRVVQQPPDQFESVAASLDPEIVQILERALAKDPAERYQDLSAMRHDLQRVRQRLEREVDDETIVLHRVSAPGAATETPPLAAELADAVAQAQSAIEAIDIGATHTAIDRVRNLGAESHIILSLQDRLADVLNLRQAQEWTDEARQLFSDGALTAAFELARRAELLTPDQPQVATLLGTIEQARSQRDDERTRLLTITRELGRARSAFDDGAFELAVRIADGVLALDPANHAARTLSVQAAEAAERRTLQQHEESAKAAVGAARALFDTGSREPAIDRLRAYAPRHAIVDEAIGSWTEELEAINRTVRRSRALALLQAGRTAIGQEDFGAAAGALDELREVPADAGEEVAALAGELQRAREAAAERARIAGVIGQIETALDDGRIDAVEPLWNELPEVVRDSTRARPLLERWQAFQSSAELARQFDESLARAASAFGDQQLEQANTAVRDALRLRPDDESALALQRRIGDAVVERNARALVAEAEAQLKAGDLDRAARSVARARTLDAAHDAVNAVGVRIEAAQQAAVEAARRRAELAQSARTAISQEHFEAAAATLEELRQLPSVAGSEASAIAVDLQRAREAFERRLRAADLIARLSTALDDQRLDAADALITQYRDGHFDPEPVRPLIERARGLRHAADLARQFDDAIGRAQSALEGKRLELAGTAIADALRVRPADEAAIALKRLIDAAVVAREAEQRAAALRREIDDAVRALERGDLEVARASVARVLALDAGNTDARRLAGEIAEAERRAAAERDARRLIGEAEQRLKAGDLDLAATLIGEAKALDAAPEAVDAVASRIEIARQAAAEEEARRRAVASGLDAAKVAVAERRFEERQPGSTRCRGSTSGTRKRPSF